MQFTSSVLFLFVATLAAAASPKGVSITANYDQIPTDPDFLGGPGSPIPSPYKRLNYSSKVTVIPLKEEVISELTPPSGDNCIQITNVTRYRYNSLFTKIDADDSFTLRGFSFACAYDLLEEAEPIRCELQLSCDYNSLSGNSATIFSNYTGTYDFQPVNTKDENLRNCAFTIHRVGNDGNYTLPITVFFDDFRYLTFLASK